MRKKYAIKVDKGFNLSYTNLSDGDKNLFLNFMNDFEEDIDLFIKKSQLITDSQSIYTFPVSKNLRVLYYIKSSSIIILEIVDISKNDEFRYLRYNSFDLLNHEEQGKVHNKINRLIYIIGILVIAGASYFINQKIFNHTNEEHTSTGSVSVISGSQINIGSGDNNIIEQSGSTIQKVVIFSGLLSLRNYDQEQINTMTMFPKIKIGTGNIGKAILRIKVDFNKDYQQYRRGRIYGYKADGTPAKGFVYALRVAVGDIRNGGYFDTVRIYTDEVKSDPDNGLFGATQGVNIIGGKIFEINLGDFKIANKQGSLGYINQNFIPYLNKMKGKVIPIGAYLSDLKGTQIEYIEIEYIGDEGAIIGIE